MSAHGMTVTILATELAAAVAKDERPEAGGFDLSAGMFGTAVSEWIRKVAEVIDLQNAPIKYVQINGRGPTYALHGTSSINAFGALEKEEQQRLGLAALEKPGLVSASRPLPDNAK